MRGYLSRLRFARAAALLLALVFAAHAGDARADDAFDLKAANDTRLAYVVTGLADVDDMSRMGLTAWATSCATRTSLRAAGPDGRRRGA
ncbi:MAG: hypothetical protein WDN08_12795 [Rhizomicrobium sp.]